MVADGAVVDSAADTAAGAAVTVAGAVATSAVVGFAVTPTGAAAAAASGSSSASLKSTINGGLPERRARRFVLRTSSVDQTMAALIKSFAVGRASGRLFVGPDGFAKTLNEHGRRREFRHPAVQCRNHSRVLERQRWKTRRMT